MKILAIVPFGSRLYNTSTVFHDVDIVLIVDGHRRSQVIKDTLDVHIVPVTHLLDIKNSKNVMESEVALAIEYGHAIVFDTPWKPMILSIKAGVPAYGDTIRRYMSKNSVPAKHRVRYDIFLKRFWETGNADPKLSDEERQEWLELYTAAS